MKNFYIIVFLSVYTGVTHWQVRVWSLVTALIEAKQSGIDTATQTRGDKFDELESKIRFVRNDRLMLVRFRDMQVWANSVDPDQTAPLNWKKGLILWCSNFTEQKRNFTYIFNARFL